MSVPDAEALVTAYLKDQGSVEDLGARVVGVPPDDKSTPWVQVLQIDYPAVEGHRSEHLLEWLGQLDCYAGKEGGQAEASALARGVREAIRVMADQAFEDVVVTGHRVISAPRLSDDAVESTGRVRYPLTVAIYLHAR
jgi:hypothetical protein